MFNAYISITHHYKDIHLGYIFHQINIGLAVVVFGEKRPRMNNRKNDTRLGSKYPAKGIHLKLMIRMQNACICGEMWSETDDGMIQCTECTKWTHTKCAGVMTMKIFHL